MPNVHSIMLQTKLHRPPVTQTLVQRPYLLERLNASINQRLTLVCAPAGFGKSTLVSVWIENLGPAGWPSAWLSLEKTDSDPVVFLRYVIAALRTIFDDACPKTFELLQARRLPPMKIIATWLSNEIDQLSGNFVLVLDDFQSIWGEAVPGLINELLLHWPRPLHLVLISRNNPPLPLATLRASDWLAEIRSHDLRFNKEETGRFLGQVLHTPVSEPALEGLHAMVEGWIGALRLVSLSLRTHGDMKDLLAALERSHAVLLEYLIDEVLEKQFPAIRTFLLKTSILDRYSITLCEAVLGEFDAAWSVRGCIDWLEREELFVIALDERKEWYRYHHLLQELLQLRLSAVMRPETVADLHGRASAWFEGQGMLNMAFKHAQLADNPDLVVGLMKRGLPEALNRTDWRTMEGWLGQFPEEVIQRQPWLLIIRAWTMHFTWRLSEVSRILNQVERLLDEGGGGTASAEDRHLLHGQIALLKAQDAFYHNRLDQAKTLSQDTVTLLPTSWKFPHGGAMFYLGLSMQANGEGQAAARLLLDLYEPVTDKSDAYALRLLHGLCFIYFNDGLLESTRQIALVLLQQAMRSRDMNTLCWARYFLGQVYYQWNDLDAAEQEFAAIIANRDLCHFFALENARAGLVMVHVARGDFAEAAQALELASQYDIERLGQATVGIHSSQARLMLLQANPAGAFRWADAFSDPIPDQAMLWQEVPHLTKAGILLARGSPNDLAAARQILDGLLEIAERTHNKSQMMAILALRALALDAQGKAADAWVALRRAVELSIAGGFLRVFIDLGRPMQALLIDLAHEDHSAEVQRILDAFPDKNGTAMTDDSPGKDSPRPVERLTPRERQILARLQEPKSLKEIAADLDLRYSTVKRHTANIYGKLGVNSRWDAVAKATELAILPAR